MKKIITLIICVFIFITCGSLKTNTLWKNIGIDGFMIEDVDKVINHLEFNILCEKENISHNIENWVQISYGDYHGGTVEQWLYIKDTDTNRIYILSKYTDSTYVIKIRNIIPE